MVANITYHVYMSWGRRYFAINFKFRIYIFHTEYLQELLSARDSSTLPILPLGIDCGSAWLTGGHRRLSGGSEDAIKHNRLVMVTYGRNVLITMCI